MKFFSINQDFFLFNRILNVSQAKLEPLVKYLPLLLDKLLLLLVKPPILNNCIFNIGQAVFETIATVVKVINIVSIFFQLFENLIIY